MGIVCLYVQYIRDYDGRVRIACALVGSDAILKEDYYEPGELGRNADLLQLIDADGLEQIDFLKMDIEGSEFGAFSPPGRRALASWRWRFTRPSESRTH